MSPSPAGHAAYSSSNNSRSSESSQYRSTIEIPSMNPHNDCISFLAAAQYYELDFVSLTWEKGRGQVGLGATSVIWQSSASRSVDFIYKRLKLAERPMVDDHDEEKAFNALVSEISVLRHPLIQHHQNIVNLEGICWEVSPQNGKAWPVLILEKAPLGDLESFMFSEEGRATTIYERLGLCGDVANAIIALHSYDMSHGDLKPANALIFRNGTSDTYAKVADFGYAGWAIGNTENIVVYPPKSWPWNAPEHHYCGFTVPAAKKLDVYSFGLLCLWLLFFDKPSFLDPGAYKKYSSQWPLERFDILDRMKYEDTLKDFACFQVSSVQVLSATQKANLIHFFLSAIVLDPEKRATDLEELIELLGHSWEPGPISLDAEQKEIDHSRIEFGIAKSFYPLMNQHFRVHNYTFTCLCNRLKSFSPEQNQLNHAFQLAFCYKTGFGTPADEQHCLLWLQHAQRRVQDLDMEVNLARSTMIKSYYRNGVFHNLSSDSLLIESSQREFGGDELRKAEEYYRRVLQDTERVFGPCNCCVIGLKLQLAYVLRATRKLEEAEVLLIRWLRDFKGNSGYDQMSQKLDTRSTNLMTERRRYLKIEEAPDGPPLAFVDPPADSPLLIETVKPQGEHPAIDSLLDCLDNHIPETADLLRSLTYTYSAQGRWSETKLILLHLVTTRIREVGQSHPLTLSMASQLANVYQELGLWLKAEQIYLHISQIQAHVLGEHHRRTLETRAELAFVYGSQSRLSEAEQLILQVLETQRRVLGEMDLSTLASMKYLAIIQSKQGRFQSSLKLKRQLTDSVRHVLGPEHPDTLSAMHLVCVDLFYLGLWSELKRTISEVIERRKATFGPEDPRILPCRTILAAINQNEGLLQQSEAELKFVLQAECKIYGETHPESIKSMLNLAVVVKSQGRLAEAESLGAKALESSEKQLGEKHETSLNAANQLACIYSEQLRLEEAAEQSLRVVALGREILGEKHPDYLQYLADLAEVRFDQTRYREAEDIAAQVVKGRIDVLGEDHADTVVGKVRLARYLDKQRRWEESNTLFTEAIEQRKKLKGDEHDDTLRAKRFLALSLWSQGRWKGAISGFYESSRLVRTIRSFFRASWGNPACILLLPGVLTLSAIAYKARKHVLKLGFDFCVQKK